MADVTPIYGLPFLEVGDSPDLASDGEDSMTAVEAQLARIDAAIASLAPVLVKELTLLSAQANTAFAAGAPACSTTFVAPDSGIVFVTVSGELRGNATNAFPRLGFEVRLTDVLGAVHTAAADDQCIVSGQFGAAITDFRVGASRECLVTGLTPGATYFVRTMQKTNAATYNVYGRELLIKKVP